MSLDLPATALDPGEGFHENHRAQLRLTFQHIDKLLSEGSRVLAGADDDSPFNKYTPDATPLQRTVAASHVARLRAAMVRAMRAQGIPFAPPVCGALWAARNGLTFAKIAAEELTPKHLRGYGALSDGAGAEVDRLRVELHGLLERFSEYLAQGAGGDLQARLARLENTGGEIALLRELERIVTTHGLVEVRGSLAAILDRLESGDTFEVGIFGRVSAGKSSLLNGLLGGDFLPVGVTPVTALPIRLHYGAQPTATVTFAERRDPLRLDLARLPEYASEQQNPANTKHVARIDVAVPAPRLLREGVTFVDTPGLGSLATAGAAEAVAYLPRCDLGLVLVDAGAALAHEDLVIVQALYQAGAAAQVLVSKADLLAPADRTTTLDYLRSHLQSEVGVSPAVHLVSVAPGEAELCETWLRTQLRSLLDAHKEHASAARRRKVGLLREAVVRALQARSGQAVPPGETAKPQAPSESNLREVAAQLEAARQEAYAWPFAVAGLTSKVIASAAAAIAERWRADAHLTPDLPAMLYAALADAVNPLTVQARQRLGSLRSAVVETFQSTSDHPNDPDETPVPGPLPMLHPPATLQRLTLRRPVLLPVLGRSWAQGGIARQIEEQIGADLQAALRPYGEGVRAWFSQALDELKAAFVRRADLWRAGSTRVLNTAGLVNGVDADAAARDLSLLQSWKEGRSFEVATTHVRSASH